MDWMRDGVWQFVGVLLSLVALATTYLIYRRQTTIKRLGFGVLSQTRLLTVRMDARHRIKILYDGHEVSEPTMLLVRIVNIGNVPILTEDFDRAFRVVVDEMAIILSAEVAHQQPSDLDASINILASQIELDPLLLNPRDSVDIKILLSQYSKQVKPMARIRGVPVITDLASKADRGYVLRSYPAGVFVSIFGIFFLLSITYSIYLKHGFTAVSIISAMVVTPLVLLMLYQLWFFGVGFLRAVVGK